MSPILFHFGRFPIYAYGFFIAVGFVAATVLAALRIRKSNIKISFENGIDLFFYTVLSAFLGSRILYVLLNFDFFANIRCRCSKYGEGDWSFMAG